MDRVCWQLLNGELSCGAVHSAGGGGEGQAAARVDACAGGGGAGGAQGEREEKGREREGRRSAVLGGGWAARWGVGCAACAACAGVCGRDGGGMDGALGGGSFLCFFCSEGRRLEWVGEESVRVAPPL